MRNSTVNCCSSGRSLRRSPVSGVRSIPRRRLPCCSSSSQQHVTDAFMLQQDQLHNFSSASSFTSRVAYEHETHEWYGEALNSVNRTYDDEEGAIERRAAVFSSARAPGPSNRKLKYETVMLKVSGEALQGKGDFGVDPTVMRSVAEEVSGLVKAGVKVAIVVGGGNYFRGANAWQGLERATADYVGMLATVMNALQLQGALESLGIDTRVQTAIEMREVAEPYIRRRAVAHLQAGRVVIFGAGTGNPFFTTDTAAALRAAEVNAEVFIKATKVDGIYDCDPVKNPHAKKYNKLSYRQCTNDSLRVMDETAITLCKENNIPVLVLNMLEKGNILRAALGEQVGTVVCEQCEEEGM
eukprot:CAMPEP_0202901652 /NCGR_PEP_ID=MMETSP1392-20130828/14376_1 /ASSEMBLY_ACC=CAM_ASM_000868 /TAXON_ID=225041 /ORGANISM="Chlamydomonas chlamydogama, Strain SAG 11-48b" /LENGTH=354 /DNA_ID=CAMNT_0049588245 /DNA_START=183 /DNA_END=1247 /DNA_ORIENTATION=-